MKHSLLSIAGLLLLVGGFIVVEKVRAQYPQPIPVPFIGFTVASIDPIHCTPGLSPLNWRSDLSLFHMCSATDTWVTILQSASPTFTGTATGGAFSGTTFAGTTGTFSAGLVPINTAYTTFWAGGVSPTLVTSGTDTTGIQNQQWIAPVFIPVNTSITGIAYLIGPTGGTDKAIAALYSNAGALLANSTVTASGTTVGTAATMQSLAFTAPYAAAGPANYWLTIQTNGTTAHIRTAPTGAFFTAVQAAGAATPLATITVPTSFTTAQAPVASTY